MDKILYIQMRLTVKKHERKDINDFVIQLEKLKLYTILDVINHENDFTLVLHKEDKEERTE